MTRMEVRVIGVADLEKARMRGVSGFCKKSEREMTRMERDDSDEGR